MTVGTSVGAGVAVETAVAVPTGVAIAVLVAIAVRVAGTGEGVLICGVAVLLPSGFADVRAGVVAGESLGRSMDSAPMAVWRPCWRATATDVAVA